MTKQLAVDTTADTRKQAKQVREVLNRNALTYIKRRKRKLLQALQRDVPTEYAEQVVGYMYQYLLGNMDEDELVAAIQEEVAEREEELALPALP